jgi:hypothetical protein
MRYDEIELIGLFSGFIHDSEFKAIMQHGVYIYTKQAKNLEKLALKLNVPLPNMPSLPVTTPIDPETITDRFMYRTILNWELASLATHVQALIETIRNDTLRKLWSPKGQPVKIPTPGQPKTQYGLGAVNYHTGETLVLIHKHKRRLEVAELLQALVDKHPAETIYVAWDNASMHQDDEVEAVVRGAAGAWSCSTCPPTARGSIRLKCCGAIFAGKSPIRNSSSRCKLWLKLLIASFSATISAQRGSFPLLGHILHNFCGCT